MGKRKEAEDFILDLISKITKGSKENVENYKRFFATLSDEDFEKYINDLDTETKYLTIVFPNFSKEGPSTENNLKIADELGHNFFQKLWIEDKQEGYSYLTPKEYLIVDMNLRRASQLLTKKISVPDDNKVVDKMTGQPTGESKGARISYTELRLCVSMNLPGTMTELVKYRGGDSKGFSAMNAMVAKLGKANLDVLKNYDSGVESSKTVNTILNCMHLGNTLLKTK